MESTETGTMEREEAGSYGYSRKRPNFTPQRQLYRVPNQKGKTRDRDLSVFGKTETLHRTPEGGLGLRTSNRGPRRPPGRGSQGPIDRNSDPQTGVAPGLTRGRNVRSKCR